MSLGTGRPRRLPLSGIGAWNQAGWFLAPAFDATSRTVSPTLVASSGTVRSTPLRAPRTCSSTTGWPEPVLSRPPVSGTRRRSTAGNTVMNKVPPRPVWAKA